jgi:hypothetical protein
MGDRILQQTTRDGDRTNYDERIVSTIDLTLSCDSDAGSDDNLYGTVAEPFATFARLLQRVPDRFKHVFNLLVAGSHGGPNADVVMDYIFEGGQLNIIGVGAPVVLTYLDEDDDEQPATYEIDIVDVDPMDSRPEIIALGTAPDDGQAFVRFDDGAAEGLIFPIFSLVSGEGGFTIHLGVEALGCGALAGDTFSIVVPATTITANSLALSIRDFGSGDVRPLNICNITIDLSDSKADMPIVLRGNGAEQGIGLSFARILLKSGGGGGGEA